MAEEEREKTTSEAEEDAAERKPQTVKTPGEKAELVLEEKRVELGEKEFAELKKKAEERDDYLNMLLRTRADFQNYQKRMKKEVESLNRLAVQDVMSALLPVVDNLSRAVKSAGKDDSKALQKFLHGVELIQGQLLKVLEGFGVRPLHGQEGQAFNPELHEAVMEVENDELPHHTVLEEVEQGFFLHDKVLRPAKVKVSRRTVAEAGGKEAEEGEAPSKGAGETHRQVQQEPPESTQQSDDSSTVGEEEPVV